MQNTPLGISRIDHVSWTVEKLDAVVEYYERVFGAQVLYRLGPMDGAQLPHAEDTRDWSETHPDIKGARLKLAMLVLPGEVRIEIFEYARKPGKVSSPAPCDQVGSRHLNIEVHNLDKAAQVPRDNGYTIFDRIAFSEGPTSDSQFQHLLDPWNNIFELASHARPA